MNKKGGNQANLSKIVSQSSSSRTPKGVALRKFGKEVKTQKLLTGLFVFIFALSGVFSAGIFGSALGGGGSFWRFFFF
jgi:hypothetical protein